MVKVLPHLISRLIILYTYSFFQIGYILKIEGKLLLSQCLTSLCCIYCLEIHNAERPKRTAQMSLDSSAQPWKGALTAGLSLRSEAEVRANLHIRSAQRVRSVAPPPFPPPPTTYWPAQNIRYQPDSPLSHPVEKTTHQSNILGASQSNQFFYFSETPFLHPLARGSTTQIKILRKSCAIQWTKFLESRIRKLCNPYFDSGLNFFKMAQSSPNSSALSKEFSCMGLLLHSPERPFQTQK